MSRHKRILLIVEGSTDARVVAPPFNAYFADFNRSVYPARPFGFDVTTLTLFPGDARAGGYMPPAHDVFPIVRQHANEAIENSAYSNGSFSHVAQLIDLDGAFCPPEAVVQNDTMSEVEYTEHEIITSDRSRQLEIMVEKTNQVRRLLRHDSIRISSVRRDVPYRLFFMSRNLEHAFLGLSGTLSQGRKDDLATQLAARYAADPKTFIHVLMALYAIYRPAPDSRPDWLETWQYAMTGRNSLKRGSNLILLPRFVTGN